MSQDRITQLRIGGMRAIDEVTLDVRGLTVLIGANGSGKSTLLEALELLRQAAKPAAYVQDVVVRAHGVLQSLLRRGARELRLGDGRGGRAQARVRFLHRQRRYRTTGRARKSFGVYDAPDVPKFFAALVRTGKTATIRPALDMMSNEVTVDGDALAISSFGITAPPLFQRLQETLGRLEYHVPFETRPLWQQQELGIQSGPRKPAMVERAHTLARYGHNLPNCYQQLRNLGQEVWERVLERARMGLGDDLRDFRLPPSGRGNIELEVVFGRALDMPIPAEALSEGQLSYLAFLALVELNQARSLLAFDEPEDHLHPALLSRVVWMLEDVARTCPVIVATHSDRFLDALADPASSVVLCELDEQRAIRVRRPNAERLAKWLESYRGLGAIRAEGYEAQVFDDEDADRGAAEGGR